MSLEGREFSERVRFVRSFSEDPQKGITQRHLIKEAMDTHLALYQMTFGNSFSSA